MNMTSTSPRDASSPETASSSPSPDAPPVVANSAWAKLGRVGFRRRWWVLGTWVTVLVTVVALVGTIGASSDSSFSIPDSESKRGFDTLDEYYTAFRRDMSRSYQDYRRFTYDEAAVLSANSTRYGLAASVFTDDQARARRVARALKSGTVWINCHNRLFAEAETGGYRDSGLGRLHGLEGLAPFMETKHVYAEYGRLNTG